MAVELPTKNIVILNDTVTLSISIDIAPPVILYLKVELLASDKSEIHNQFSFGSAMLNNKNTVDSFKYLIRQDINELPYEVYSMEIRAGYVYIGLDDGYKDLKIKIYANDNIVHTEVIKLSHAGDKDIEGKYKIFFDNHFIDAIRKKL